MSEIIFPNSRTAIMPAAGVIVSMPSPGDSPTQPIVKDPYTVNSTGIVNWGTANNFPQMILEKGRRSTIIPAATRWQANLISQKLIPYQVHYEGEKEILESVNDPEIWEFITNRHFKRYQRESANDIFWFLNIFPELILSKDRKKITHIHPNEAAYTRIGVQNEAGVSEFAYINANWPHASWLDEETFKIRMLDPYQYDLVQWTREQHSSVFKFIFPSSYPTPGNTFYQLAHWDGVRTSGWLDQLEKVPKVKNGQLDNQMTIKYHIQIPFDYWPRTFGDAWQKATPEQQSQMKQDKLREWNQNTTGPDKTGIVMATEFGVSSVDGKSIESWKIEALPDRLKDGAYLADNMEATAHLLYALGLDPTLVGFASKEMGSRSGGSDKRESLLIYLSQLQPYRDVLLEPLNFIAEFNGWKKKYPLLEFRTIQTLLTTLDTGADAKKQAA